MSTEPTLALYYLDDWVYFVNHKTREVLYQGHSIQPAEVLRLLEIEFTDKWLEEKGIVDRVSGHENYDELMEILGSEGVTT